MCYGDKVKPFYRALIRVIETAEERRIVAAQIDAAAILPLDAGHDQFELPENIPALGPDQRWYIDATYLDTDGAQVNVIVHFADGRISWAERYRYLGEEITRWPPPPTEADASIAVY